MLVHRVDEVAARLAIADGDAGAAALAVAGLPEPARSRLDARVRLLRGDPPDHAAYPPHDARATTRDRFGDLLMRAACAAAPAERAGLVADAVTLAEPERFVGAFLDDAWWLAPSLAQAVRSWPSRFGTALLAAVQAGAPYGAHSRVDALTEREVEVWRYLATGMSMREIAAVLFISRNTLKSHVRSIYQKLDVTTREAAVEHQRSSAPDDPTLR
jgi:DNA-binding CsgD family transcriptional regulator